MPSAQPTVLASQSGSVLAISKLNTGTVDVWEIPANATITIQPAAGWGPVTQTSTGVSLADAETDINGQLVKDGAV
jgi:hypothetical protein